MIERRKGREGKGKGKERDNVLTLRVSGTHLLDRAQPEGPDAHRILGGVFDELGGSFSAGHDEVLNDIGARKQAVADAVENAVQLTSGANPSILEAENETRTRGFGLVWVEGVLAVEELQTMSGHPESTSVETVQEVLGSHVLFRDGCTDFAENGLASRSLELWLLLQSLHECVIGNGGSLAGVIDQVPEEPRVRAVLAQSNELNASRRFVDTVSDNGHGRLFGETNTIDEIRHFHCRKVKRET